VHIEPSVQASDPLHRSILENAQIGISVFSMGAAITEFDFDGALLKRDEIAKEYIGIGSAK
jgi:hypothetical protein